MIIINTSIKIETKQILNKNKILSASGLFTNSISTTRSINEEPITFEELFLKLENYDFFIHGDYLKTELSSVETFESTNLNTIPILPSINYLNFVELKNNSLMNDFDFTVLKRNDSTIDIPSEAVRIKLNSELINNSPSNSKFINKKILLNNSFNDYYFSDDKSLNHDAIKSFIFLSSDVNFNNFSSINPKIKFIIPMQLINSNKKINEDSKSITFNYQNQFSENRFFGNDLFDNAPRVVYGMDSNLKRDKYDFDIKFNQSYEINSNGNYSNNINQNSKFSDYAIEAKLDIKNIILKLDSRLDHENLSKKEMNYSLNSKGYFDFSLNYNETQAEAFKKLSNDTQSIDFEITKKISNYLMIGYSSNLDVKNNFDPYKSLIKVSLFDECSQLDISYSSTRFNDNFNTQPEEKISLTFNMDYLGFFGYEQSTNLFFSEPGNLNYGL